MCQRTLKAQPFSRKTRFLRRSSQMRSSSPRRRLPPPPQSCEHLGLQGTSPQGEGNLAGGTEPEPRKAFPGRPLEEDQQQLGESGGSLSADAFESEEDASVDWEDASADRDPGGALLRARATAAASKKKPSLRVLGFQRPKLRRVVLFEVEDARASVCLRCQEQRERLECEDGFLEGVAQRRCSCIEVWAKLSLPSNSRRASSLSLRFMARTKDLPRLLTPPVLLPLGHCTLEFQLFRKARSPEKTGSISGGDEGEPEGTPLRVVFLQSYQKALVSSVFGKGLFEAAVARGLSRGLESRRLLARRFCLCLCAGIPGTWVREASNSE